MDSEFQLVEFNASQKPMSLGAVEESARLPASIRRKLMGEAVRVSHRRRSESLGAPFASRSSKGSEGRPPASGSA